MTSELLTPKKMVIAVRWRRLGAVVGCVAAIVGFLMLPPAWLPYGLLVWLLAMSFVLKHGRMLGAASLTVVVLVVVKQLDMTPTAWIAESGILAVGVLGLLQSRHQGIRTWSLAVFGVCWIAALGLLYEFEFQSRRAVFDAEANRIKDSVVCVGDSLTAYGYPKLLAEMVDWPVVDLSEDGITMEQGLRKMPEILAARPKVVVIELGGHDYLKGRPRAEIKSRLNRMISETQAAGAAVILFEIPCGLITDPTRGVFREVAREHGARLIPDTAIRKLVFCSPYFPPCRWGWLPQLSDDGIHPNSKGNQAMATAVRDAIRELDLPQGLPVMTSPTYEDDADPAR